MGISSLSKTCLARYCSSWHRKHTMHETTFDAKRLSTKNDIPDSSKNFLLTEDAYR